MFAGIALAAVLLGALSWGAVWFIEACQRQDACGRAQAEAAREQRTGADAPSQTQPERS